MTAKPATMAIEGIPPAIAAQLNYLLSNSPFPIRVEQMWSGSKIVPLRDRFTLAIPFCLDFLKWDVIYNVHSPLAAPDVNFGPEDEGFLPFLFSSKGDGDSGFTPKVNLSDWSYKDPSRLISLILHLRDLYSAYQRKRVEEVDDDRLKFEINTMLWREGIEMSMSSSPDKMEEVKFAVPLLDMDINKLVPVYPWRQQQKIFLQVIYPIRKKYSSGSSAPRLKLVSTPEMRSFFPVEDVKLASWLDGMCMAEYLPALEENLQMQILEAVTLIGARKRFIEALAPVFGRPLEADPVFCRKATVFVTNGMFMFLVHFLLPPQFLKQKPSLILQSAMHFNQQGMPVRSAPLTDFPWSPRWDSSQMAERLFEFLVDESLNFKKFCSEPQPQHS
ncbi:hypothetical protein Droror1_Dr00010256 [Drosera rotundifolia]